MAIDACGGFDHTQAGTLAVILSSTRIGRRRCRCILTQLEQFAAKIRTILLGKTVHECLHIAVVGLFAFGIGCRRSTGLQAFEHHHSRTCTAHLPQPTYSAPERGRETSRLRLGYIIQVSKRHEDCLGAIVAAEEEFACTFYTLFDFLGIHIILRVGFRDA